MLYAWGQFRPGTVRDVGNDTSPDLPNLLSNVLLDGTNRLLKRGLDRGYIQATEDTRRPRGKLRLDLMIKRQTMSNGFAVCDIDEFTADVIHNRILKETLRQLSICMDVKKNTRQELQRALQRFNGVSNTRITGDLFHRIQLSRNSAHYSLLMKVCELVFHALMPDERGVGSKFNSILDNEKRMATIFETFLRNFYRAELKGFTSNARILKWDATDSTEEDLAMLPVMKTDVTLEGKGVNKGKIIVADAKYYKDALTKNQFGSRTIRSAHLYQLSTYLEHYKRKHPGAELKGMLLYPSNGKDLRYHYNLLGSPVVIATVNLDKPWKEVHSELLSLV